MTLGEIDLSHLTDEEKNKVLEVLQRDKQLREAEQKRVRNLKDEVKSLRLKGTIREGHSATRTCARCRESFGFFFNTGSTCAKCQHRVCKKCQESVAPGKWICIFCFRQMEFEAKSGNWFFSKFPRSMRDRVTNEIISGGKLVQDAISGGNFVDGLDPEMVSSCTANVAPQLSFLSSAAKNRTALEAHACFCSEHVHEVYKDSASPAECVVPCDVEVLKAGAQFRASEQTGDATMMGFMAYEHVENVDCSVHQDSEWIQDSAIPNTHAILARSEECMAMEQTESDVMTKLVELKQTKNIGEGEVEALGELSAAEQSLSGTSEQPEDSDSKENVALKGSEDLGAFANFRESAGKRDTDVEQCGCSEKKEKDCGSSGLYDSNDSAFEDEEDGELCLFGNCECVREGARKGLHVLGCVELAEFQRNKSRNMEVQVGSDSMDSSVTHVSGSKDLLIPCAAVSDIIDLSLPLTVGSKGSSMPTCVNDSVDVANSTSLLATDCEDSVDLKSKRLSISDLMLTSDRDMSASSLNSVDNLVSHHLVDDTISAPCLINEDIAACHFTSEDISASYHISEDVSSCHMSEDNQTSCHSSEDILTSDDLNENTPISCSTSEAVSAADLASYDTSASHATPKDVLLVAETRDGGYEEIPVPNATYATDTSACMVLSTTSDLMDGKCTGKLPVVLPGTIPSATDLVDEECRMPVTSCLKSDMTVGGCEIAVMLPGSSDVTDVQCSRASCETDVETAKTPSCVENILLSSVVEYDNLGSSSPCEFAVRSYGSNSYGNCSAGCGDSVRSKVGALLAKYGRNLDCEQSPEGRNASNEGKNLLYADLSRPYIENTQVSPSYQPSTSIPSPTTCVVKDNDNLTNKQNLNVLDDSSVLANNNNNSNNCIPIFDETFLNSKDNDDDYLGQFGDYREDHAFRKLDGPINSPAKQPWNQLSLPEEENGMDSFGSSDSLSRFGGEKCNFLLDDLEWDAGELDGLNEMDNFGIEAVESSEALEFNFYPFGTSESHSTNLTALRDILSSCISSSSTATGSPPLSPSECDNAVIFDQPSVIFCNSKRFPSRQKSRRTLTNRRIGSCDVTDVSNDDDDDNESLLSTISEHTEPDSLSD